MRSSPARHSKKRRPSLTRILAWLALTTALWTLLSSNSGWYLGIPVVLLATGAAATLNTRPWTLRIQHLPAFALFFLHNSLRGGWDVALRTLRRTAPVAPAWARHELRTEDPAVRLALSAIVGLLPGTLASHFDDTHLHIHLLDENTDWQGTVGKLEQLLIRLSGVERSH
ncbi:MAG: Na+/H+ antiporter subunit E [Pseudohongiellaceae bacterium]